MKLSTRYYLFSFYLAEQSDIQVSNKKTNKNYEYTSKITNKYQEKINFIRKVVGTRIQLVVKCG